MLFAFFLLLGAISLVNSVHYTPDWESLDSRPLPDWYDKAKIGIFMHLGPYSVPSFVDEWFWNRWRSAKREDVIKFMEENYPPNFTYQDFGPQLTMEFFNASAVADLVAASGAKYFVFTSKHHDGFTNFPSPYTFGWNSVDIGPKRDIVGELRHAFDQHPDIHFGLYYSLFEWFNPMYLKDKENHYNSQVYVDNKMLPEMEYLIENYAPDVLWSDGDWEATPEYFKSKKFLAWLYNFSPSKDTIVTNDRWGKGTRMRHGGYYSGSDRFNPGHLLKHKFEDAFTVDTSSWGYRRTINLASVKNIDEIIREMVTVVSCNGNALINVGPTKEGTIIPIFQERLVQLGSWLKINGEAIYESKPWTQQKDSVSKTPEVWYTAKNDAVYAISLGWPNNDTLTLGDIKTSSTTSINIIGWKQPLKFHQSAAGVQINFPNLSQYLQACGRVCQVGQGFTLKFVNLANTGIE